MAEIGELVHQFLPSHYLLLPPTLSCKSKIPVFAVGRISLCHLGIEAKLWIPLDDNRKCWACTFQDPTVVKSVNLLPATDWSSKLLHYASAEVRIGLIVASCKLSIHR